MADSTSTSADPIWKSRRGDIAVPKMPTAHLKSAINTVETELKNGITTGEKILVDLKNELAGRSDA